MAAPFPEAQFQVLIIVLLVFLIALIAGLLLYLWRIQSQMRTEEEEESLEIDNIGLSKKSLDVMEQILEEPMLQSELPQELEVSKATVSNAVSELKERNLVKRKKRANSYLIEPDRDELEKQQR